MSNDTIDFTRTPLTEEYGKLSFSDAVMKERLPKTIYREIKNVQAGESRLSRDVAEVIANAMKDWAIENGATHYTHWFQPLTGLTAEKHDSFIAPTKDGKVMMEFSGKELIQGEPDASSFPSGGLRATFEARGYTAWDTTSPAFLREDKTGITLYIPTAFVSYNGEALDKKVPLLRSMEALSKQAIRVLRCLGNTTSRKVVAESGPEQEYFLVEKELYLQRPDLILTGRTVFGTMPAKGQELSDHYFGSIKERVAGFMQELNYELWKLGISAKTQHNEVAPNQFELATIYDVANSATDRNQLVMDTMKKVADRHNLVALLHEKPFAGVNGSGKHNNWSMGTDDGIGLLRPGTTPHDNAQFLLFVVAVLKAIDKYAPLLRASAASAGNDHRLGGHEAPPAIISVFLGAELTDILEKLARGEKVKAKDGGALEIGVNSLPVLPKDTTDRNRTSPFAFTGNKFEFRMVGSNQSTADSNTVLNVAVTEVLDEFAGILESAKDKNTAVQKIIKDTYKAHSRIVFNGNGYSEEWKKDAEKRGLPNMISTVEALPELTSKEAVRIFSKHKVLSRNELKSRLTIYLEDYSMKVNIEAAIALEMANTMIRPAIVSYLSDTAAALINLEDAGIEDTAYLKDHLTEVNAGMKALSAAAAELGKALENAQGKSGELAKAKAYRESVIPAMEKLRKHADGLETKVGKEYWPFPDYQDLLFTL
ncbi:MAG: glutamine synthetase III [Spirochaetales bacterium]|nr:glutamine synthetase III [Spirochaetales bacterium]